jgi:hypothetical protein
VSVDTVASAVARRRMRISLPWNEAGQFAAVGVERTTPGFVQGSFVLGSFLTEIPGVK